MTDPIGHIPVLCNEIIELLAPKPGDIVVDCTAGRGGHAQELAAIVAPGGGRVIGLDLDPDNLAFATNRLAALGLPFTPHHASYARLPEILAEEGLDSVLIGPHDLSTSLGVPEQYDHQRFLEACETILGKARAAGIGAGIHHWLPPEQQIQFVNMGANLLIHKADITFFHTGLQRELGEIKTLLGESHLQTGSGGVSI